MIQLPIRMPNFPPLRESVVRVVSAENLRAVASHTTDPTALLGLAFLARPGEPVGKEIAQRAAGSKPEYESIPALLTVMMERIDKDSVADLLERDPQNALGHYLQGALLYVANHESEGLVQFRVAADQDLQTYDALTGEALIKGLDALGLSGLDRLCALSWATARWTNFGSLGIQPVYQIMSELAKRVDPTARAELADILLKFAGQLFNSNFSNRFFAVRAAEAGFVLKAEQEAEHLAKRRGYAAAVYGLVSPLFSVPGIREWWNHSPQQLAHFLPGRIHQAFAAAEPSLVASTYGERNLEVPESERAALETAKANASQAAKKLLDAALVDPDEIFGSYLKGLPRIQQATDAKPVFEWTPVESLMTKKPDLFQAAAENEKAMAALWQAGENAPSRRNVGRMMEISWAIENYAQQHDQIYPTNLDLLFEAGYLKPPLETRSVRTGRPYVYVAAGEKRLDKANDRARFVLFYDDAQVSEGWYECAFASCVCNGLREAELREHLRARGK
jgi:hypothetical protein